MATRTLRLKALICGMALFVALTSARGAAKISMELGPEGEVPIWLVLGYLEGVESLDTERLEGIADMQPREGDTVAVPGETGEAAAARSLAWKRAETAYAEIRTHRARFKRLDLFKEPDGTVIENAEAYLYCNLSSPDERTVDLRIGAVYGFKAWLNGKEIVRSEDGADNTKHVEDLVCVAVPLASGDNHLLVRVQQTRSTKYGDSPVSARLVTHGGLLPVYDVSATLLITPENEPFPMGTPPHKSWEDVVSEIPPVGPSEDEAFFGAHLGRTMTLLKTGGQTKRPVRIVFTGQSITEQQWTDYLIRRLRERFPGTTIEAENWARGGWKIYKQVRMLHHDVLRARPDLVIIYAYQGGSWEWERIIQNIQRETTAEIILRPSHIARFHEKRDPMPLDDAESLLLRRLARKYGCEFIECRKEWLQYLRANELDPQALRSDSIHLNGDGCALMAQLHERHFRPNPAAEPWSTRVRRYEAMRPLADHRFDEIRLIGDGWNVDRINHVLATKPGDRLELRFTGSRVDAVMHPGRGSARVLIDGVSPSKFPCYQCDPPRVASWKGAPPGLIRPINYYPGTNLVAETWQMIFTHAAGNQNVRYRLVGSVTGPDGEGDNLTPFVSNSGRIRIDPDSFERNKHDSDPDATEYVKVEGDCRLMWSIRPAYVDVVHDTPTRPGERCTRYIVPYRYATLVDGLPPGDHVLTLIPEDSGFALDAVEVHRPPLFEK